MGPKKPNKKKRKLPDRIIPEVQKERRRNYQAGYRALHRDDEEYKEKDRQRSRVRYIIVKKIINIAVYCGFLSFRFVHDVLHCEMAILFL